MQVLGSDGGMYPKNYTSVSYFKPKNIHKTHFGIIDFFVSK